MVRLLVTDAFTYGLFLRYSLSGVPEARSVDAANLGFALLLGGNKQSQILAGCDLYVTPRRNQSAVE